MYILGVQKKVAASILALGLMTSVQANSQVLGPLQEYDQWTGIYLSKDKKMVAKVSKKLVKQADLFNPAKYEYELDLSDNIKPYLVANYPLALDDAGLMLVGENAGECDDPGCTYFNSETNIALNSTKNTPELAISYEWYTHPDGDIEADSGSGERLASRAFSGIEAIQPTYEALLSESLKTKAWSSVEKNAKQISPYGDFKLVTTLANAKMNIYKKAFLPNKQLSALFVVTSFDYENNYGVQSAECATLLAKEKTWKAVYTECTYGSFRDEKPI